MDSSKILTPDDDGDCLSVRVDSEEFWNFDVRPQAQVVVSWRQAQSSRRILSVLLRRANAIKVWANATKMPDQHKYE